MILRNSRDDRRNLTRFHMNIISILTGSAFIGENSKGGTSYEKAVDDVIECMGALSIAGHAVKEQREKMGLRTKPKSHDGSTEGGAEDCVDDMEDGQDGFLWRDHIEDDDGEPDK